MASPAWVSWYRVVPAWITTNDGGATPTKEENKKSIQGSGSHLLMASPAWVSWYRVVPAWMATNDGGATPTKEENKKSITGMVHQFVHFNKLQLHGPTCYRCIW